MSYQHLMAVGNSYTTATVTEFASNEAMESANLALLAEMAELDREIERSETTLDALDGVDMFAANFGAPKTQAEKVLFGMNVMQSFGGQVEFDAIMGNSMESMDDADSFGYSMESLKDKAVSIYEWIREQVMKLYAIIEKFFYNLMGGIPRARKAIKKLRARAEAASGKTAEDKKFDLNDRDQAVFVDADNKKFDGGADVIAEVEVFGKVISGSEKVFYSKLEKYAKGLKDKISEVDLDTDVDLAGMNTKFAAEESVVAIDPATVSSLFGELSKGTLVSGDTRFGEKEVAIFRLTSGKSVFLTHTKDDPSPTDVSTAESNVTRVAELKETNPKAKKVDGGSFTIFSPSEVESLCDNLETLCDSIESITRSAEKGSIEKAKKALDKAGKKLDGAYKKAKDRTGDDKLSADKITATRLMLKYIKQYANMVAKPVPQIIASSTTFMNTSLAVANKSLSQYK